jgi:hypothetical protein
MQTHITHTTTGLRHAKAALPAPSAAPRVDIYSGIHKALRQFMSDTLRRVGRLDIDDPADREATLSQVEALLEQLRNHLTHENEFVHAAIEARQRGGARHTADDHLLHLDAIANLEDEVQALRQAGEVQRGTQVQRLYRQLALFVAENLEHMQVEETQNNELLWALYSDAELEALHDAILASVPPQEMALTVRWMAASWSTQELVELCSSVRPKLPPPAFAGLLDIMRTQLDDSRWGKLMGALSLPPVPGLVAA